MTDKMKVSTQRYLRDSWDQFKKKKTVKIPI